MQFSRSKVFPVRVIALRLNLAISHCLQMDFVLLRNASESGSDRARTKLQIKYVNDIQN